VQTLTAVYLDFSDPASYRVWRWLTLLPERSAVEIRPFSVDCDPDEDCNPWDRTEPSWSIELLALHEFAREVGRSTEECFVDAAFAAVHDAGADLSSMEGWLEIGAKAGLDLAAYTSDSDRWHAEVGLWHKEAEDDLGVSGVPTVVFDDERALLVRLDHDISDVEAARRLLADLSDLATQPVDKVRRSG
jgi:2-hydroxychromene-2-carboxylate isomerase